MASINQSMASSSSASSSKNRVTLKSSDGEAFEVAAAAAGMSELLKNMVDEKEGCILIPLPNVNSKILAKIVEFCNKHIEAPELADNLVDVQLQQWDAEFVQMDLATLYNLIIAADYLNNQTLLDVTCKAVADKIEGKPIEEIREIFDIENDLSPEEEENIRRENPWTFT